MSEGLMDYSLLVAMKSELPTVSADKIYTTYNANGDSLYLCLSIIDFLQSWGCGKRCARGIKVFECNKATVPPGIYGKRFQRHFEKCFVVHEPKAETVGKTAEVEV